MKPSDNPGDNPKETQTHANHPCQLVNPDRYRAAFSRQKIINAYAALEADFNVGGCLRERPSCQRRGLSVAAQLHRMGVAILKGKSTFEKLTPAERAIYVRALIRFGLGPQADEVIVNWAIPMIPYARQVGPRQPAPRRDHPLGGKVPYEAAPTAEQVRQARQAAGDSQAGAASRIWSKLRSWQQWEAGDRTMHPGLFELYRLKTGQLVLDPAGAAIEA